MAMLRRLLVADYGALKERLARRFGSADFATEVLHETWLRLHRTELDRAGEAPRSIHNPAAYLHRIALNIATDRQRVERRWIAKAEIEALVRDAVEELDPARTAEARSELQALSAALEALPPRRRAVFIASRSEGLSHKAIAERLGVSVRIVDRELNAALKYFGTVLEKKLAPRRGPRPLQNVFRARAPVPIAGALPDEPVSHD
jgi:RNA polymerase sigma factor (sigma-70 family)